MRIFITNVVDVEIDGKKYVVYHQGRFFEFDRADEQIRNVELSRFNFYRHDSEHERHEAAKVMCDYEEKAYQILTTRDIGYAVQKPIPWRDDPHLLIQRVFWLPPLPDLVVFKVVRCFIG